MAGGHTDGICSHAPPLRLNFVNDGIVVLKYCVGWLATVGPIAMRGGYEHVARSRKPRPLHTELASCTH